MFFVEPAEFAPQWLRDTVEKLIQMADENSPIGLPRVTEPRAYALIRLYEADPVKHPSLRDRTDEATRMLRGLVGDLNAGTTSWTNHGAEFYKLGTDFPCVGAQFSAKFKLIIV